MVLSLVLCPSKKMLKRPPKHYRKHGSKLCVSFIRTKCFTFCVCECVLSLFLLSLPSAKHPFRTCRRVPAASQVRAEDATNLAREAPLPDTSLSSLPSRCSPYTNAKARHHVDHIDRRGSDRGEALSNDLNSVVHLSFSPYPKMGLLFLMRCPRLPFSPASRRLPPHTHAYSKCPRLRLARTLINHHQTVTLRLTPTQIHIHIQTHPHSDSSTLKLIHTQTHSHSDTHTLRLVHIQPHPHSDSSTLSLVHTRTHSHSTAHTLKRSHTQTGLS